MTRKPTDILFQKACNDFVAGNLIPAFPGNARYMSGWEMCKRYISCIICK